VELAGIEPASKQGIIKPSTSLVYDWFSSNVCPQTGQQKLIFLIFESVSKCNTIYSIIDHASIDEGDRQTFTGDVSPRV
jgi:hypothetical protein